MAIASGLTRISTVRTVSVGLAAGPGLPVPRTVCQVGFVDRTAVLVWDQNWRESRIELDPLRYPVEPGPVPARSMHFGGLHGFLADAFPDAWGMRLLRRRLQRETLLIAALNPIQLLALVGVHGRGALMFQPDFAEAFQADYDIDALASAAQGILGEEVGLDETVARRLEQLGSATGGARPKASVRQDGVDWIVKFPGPSDPVDIGPMEYVYALMAREAGLTMADCRLVTSARGPGYFATRRFDRLDAGGRVHMLSLCGALEAPSGSTAIGYDHFARATRAITRSEREVEETIRRLVFNVLAHNRDDHSRQHAFLLDVTTGRWSLSPAFDLTFSAGPGGEHDLDIAGEARRPTLAHVRKLATLHGVAPARLSQMLDRTRAAVARWGQLAAEHGVSRATRSEVQTGLDRVAADFAVD